VNRLGINQLSAVNRPDNLGSESSMAVKRLAILCMWYALTQQVPWLLRYILCPSMFYFSPIHIKILMTIQNQIKNKTLCKSILKPKSNQQTINSKTRLGFKPTTFVLLVKPFSHWAMLAPLHYWTLSTESRALNLQCMTKIQCLCFSEVMLNA